MDIFITGATGWVGSVIVRDLLSAGHHVTGLARSEDKAAALDATGASALRGNLDDLDLLKRAADRADAVVHTAFNHDFSRFAENCAEDARVIEAFGSVLEGSDRPLLVTSVIAMVAAPGRLATEDDRPPAVPLNPRRSEVVASELAARGVHVSAVRLPPTVHGPGDHGFMAVLADLALKTGVSAYIGDGLNRWPAVHRHDAGRLYRLILEHGANEPAYHAVAEEGIAFKEIAEAIGRRLALPVEARGPEHFGWFAAFAGLDMAASGKRTRELLGWEPAEADLLADLEHPGYFGPGNFSPGNFSQ